jgi:hypothetical protein
MSDLVTFGIRARCKLARFDVDYYPYHHHHHFNQERQVLNYGTIQITLQSFGDRHCML